MPPRAKVTLTPAQTELLRAALRESLEDATGFPAGSDRHDRLERWIQRLDDRFSDRSDRDAIDLRLKGADGDVLLASLGSALGRLRASTKQDFDRLCEALTTPRSTAAADLTCAEQDLARLEDLETLYRLLKTAVAQETGRPAGRRRILP